MKLTTSCQMTLLELVRNSFPEISASKAKKIILHGCCSYCGGIVKSPELVLPSKAFVEYEKYVGGSQMKAEVTPLPVLFEDEFFLVAVKPAGMKLEVRSHPGQTSFFSLMKAYVRKKSRNHTSLYLVHQMETRDAGLCVLAKDKRMQELLKTSWGKDTFLYFRALIHGNLPKKNDTLTFWLEKNNKDKPRRLSVDASNGLRTQTEYRVLGKHEMYSEVDLIPYQDYPPQLHYCMERMGTPIVGDHIYGDDLNPRRFQKLFGYKLQLKHPATARRIILEMSLPETFREVSSYKFRSTESEKKDNNPLS